MAIKRLRFHPSVYRAIMKRERCICYLCGERLASMATTEFDHRIALELLGEDCPENLFAVHAHCHKRKTAADQKLIAKNKRLRRQRHGQPKRNPRFRRTVSGKVIERKKEPWETW